MVTGASTPRREGGTGARGEVLIGTANAVMMVTTIYIVVVVTLSGGLRVG